MAEEAPDWYRTALASKARHGTTHVAGADIAYSAWGEPGGEGLVLVHGGAANARWWDHVAPLLAEQRQVVAVDLSGHGDSARRPAYGLDVWAEEVHAVIAAADIRRPAVVVGHSMGGFVTLQTANRYGAELNGVIILDSPVHDLTPEERAAFDQRALRAPASISLARSGDRAFPAGAGTGLCAAVRRQARGRELGRRIRGSVDVEVRSDDLSAGRNEP